MRSDDEDEEDEYEDDIELENDEDEPDVGLMDVDGEEAGEGDDDDEDRDGDGEADGEALDGDAEGEVEEDGEDAEGEGSDEPLGGDDDEDDDDADEDESDAEVDDDDDEDDEEGDEEDDKIQLDQPSSPVRSNASQTQSALKRSLSPAIIPLPPHKIRRSLLLPAFHSTTRPTHLSIDAIVAIPVPAPIHCLAATACSSYLLTGSQEGVVRSYDFYGSVNGGQAMTAHQRAVVGMGDGISKAGMARGWWASDVPEGMGGEASEVGQERRVEPVYSLAVEGDGLWALTGTQSGPINLYTLRHAPGHLVHSLKGHSSVVSCMTLTTDEKRLLSGSWDGSIRDWDLNTGQTTRAYPTHGAQLSSLSLRPFAHPMSPSPSPIVSNDAGADDTMGEKPQISVSVGPDFFQPRPTATSPSAEIQPASSTIAAAAIPPAQPPIPSESAPASTGDVQMAEPTRTSRASSYDPLFDDEDAEGETLPPSAMPTNPGTPVDPIPVAGPSRRLSTLALPTNGHRANGQAAAAPPATPLRSEGAAATIPLLSPTTYKQFSDDIMLASFMDGQVMLVDRRVPDMADGGMRGVGRLVGGDKAPPWCMSATWSGNGNQILAGRRNGTIDIWDVRRSSSSTAPNLLRTLRTPAESGPVSCIVAFPDGQHVATASQDNIRLWNTVEYFEPDESLNPASSSFKKARSRPPFKIVAGHHGGTVSAMLVDPTCRFMTVASGDRGWAGESTKVVLIHEIKW